jgi:asparagine synthase (glutamine-hydrolysing)
VFLPHYFHDYPYHLDQDEETHCQQINKLLEEAVKKRLMSERPVACLLSGGLDSSLVAALAAKHYTLDEKIKTFSVGMPGSPDLAAAAEVAEHIGSEHYHVELTQQDFLDVLEETIFMLGSFDVTTIRASVGHMLISRYVRDHSDVKVLFSGETADEFGSYLYFQNAPCQESFQNEAVRLLEDIQYFDMKRGDRSISYAGLEARVPFADKAFVKYYMGIKPELRMFNEDKIEKYLIRKAFQKEGLLPESVLWRRKNGFSDSVSMKEKSWSTIIQEYVDMLVTDTEYESQKSQYEHDTPKTKEAYYYRKIFTKYYGKHQNLTPYQWLPKWCGDVVDPSARVLKIYAAD